MFYIIRFSIQSAGGEQNNKIIEIIITVIKTSSFSCAVVGYGDMMLERSDSAQRFSIPFHKKVYEKRISSFFSS